MKCIWLGIKDYCKDCWHDFWFIFWNWLDTFTSRRLYRTHCWRYNEGICTKEGSLVHYIKQRKIARRAK